MTLEDIKKLIDRDIDKAFEVLDEYFGDNNATYNDFNKEYINRPNNFQINSFRSRLKRFIKFNKEVFEKGKEESSIPNPSEPIIKEPSPEPAPPSPPDKITKLVKVFLVFNSKDEKYAKALRLHLFTNVRNGIIKLFNPYKNVPVGVDNKAEYLKKEMSASPIILLFVSQNMYEEETYEFVSQVEGYVGKKNIVPIKVTAFNLEGTVFHSIQGLPLNGVPLDQQANLDKAMMAVAKGVMNVVKRLLNE